MKHCFAILLWLTVASISAQISLNQVLSDIEKSAPEVQLMSLVTQTTALQEKNISNAWKPQLSFSGQSTYQSDVTSINVELPGIEIPVVNQFQYKVQGEVNQIVYDGGKVDAGKTTTRIQGMIEQSQIRLQLDQIELEAIKLYFNILESEKVIDALQLKAEALDARREVIKAGVNNGAVLESELLNLDAAILELQQEIAGMTSNKRTAIQALSIITGRDYPLDAEYEIPGIEIVAEPGMLNYHQLLTHQASAIDAVQTVKDSESRPQLVAFGSAGVGNPGLNFLEEGLADYYIIGMRMNWNLGTLYNKGNDRQINILKKNEIDLRKNIFDRNWKATEIQLKNQIELKEEAIHINESLVELRSSITEVASAQLDYGVINSADYILRLNEEYAAIISLDIARIQKLKNQCLLIHHYNKLP